MLVMFLLNAGMITSLKVSGCLYSGILLLLLFLVMINTFSRRRQPGSPQDKSILFGLIGLPAAALLGGFWFAKNMRECAVLFSDALRFIKPDAAYVTRIKHTTIAHLFDPGDFDHWRLFLDKVDSKLSIPFALLLILALLFPVLSIGGRKEAKDRGVHITVFLLFLVTFVIYIYTPYSADNPVSGGEFTGSLLPGNTRFAFSMMGVMGVLAALSMTFLKLRKSVTAVLATSCCLLVGYLEIQTALVVIPALYAGYFIFRKTKPVVNRKSLVACAVMTLLVLTVASYYLRSERRKRKTLLYGTVVDFVTDSIEPEEKLGYLLTERSYIFRGHSLDQDMVHVRSSTEHREQWISMLRGKGVQLIAVGPLKASWQNQNRWNRLREIEWLEEPPFEKVHGDDAFKEAVVFRLRE
jgi:hypothetical protein